MLLVHWLLLALRPLFQVWNFLGAITHDLEGLQRTGIQGMHNQVIGAACDDSKIARSLNPAIQARPTIGRIIVRVHIDVAMPVCFQKIIPQQLCKARKVIVSLLLLRLYKLPFMGKELLMCPWSFLLAHCLSSLV